MALRSIFLNLRRNCRNSCSSSKIERRVFFRSFTSASLENDVLEESPNSQENDDLKSRIFRIRLPKRSATNVLQNWVAQGNKVAVSELRDIAKELKKSNRYKHALEISEWMVSHEEYQLLDSDYAVRIDLMTKVFGIDAAERYFEGLPLTAKTCETYTALLHSCAAAKLVNKAEELFERIKESNLSLDALAYNEMMTLYMSLGQVEKVSSVVEELKCQKVTPDLFTYNLWISSCAATLNIDGVKRILDEMRCNAGSNENWLRYINLANMYLNTGHLMNSESNSLVEAEKSITQREWITYDFLIILYAGLGNKSQVDQIWKSLRMTKQKMTSRNYACILSSYLLLGHLKEVGEVVDQWKQSTTTEFDISICNKLLGALAEIGLMENADNFRSLLIQKSGFPDEVTANANFV